MGETTKSAESGDREPVEHVSFLGKGLTLSGTLKFRGNITIQGNFSGKILSGGELTVSKSARVRADIHVRSVKNAGDIQGDIEAETGVRIFQGGRVKGNIKTPALKIETGAVFSGQSEMPPPPSKPAVSEKRGAWEPAKKDAPDSFKSNLKDSTADTADIAKKKTSRGVFAGLGTALALLALWLYYSGNNPFPPEPVKKSASPPADHPAAPVRSLTSTNKSTVNREVSAKSDAKMPPVKERKSEDANQAELRKAKKALNEKIRKEEEKKRADRKRKIAKKKEAARQLALKKTREAEIAKKAERERVKKALEKKKRVAKEKESEARKKKEATARKAFKEAKVAKQGKGRKEPVPVKTLPKSVALKRPEVIRTEKKIIKQEVSGLPKAEKVMTKSEGPQKNSQPAQNSRKQVAVLSGGATGKEVRVGVPANISNPEKAAIQQNAVSGSAKPEPVDKPKEETRETHVASMKKQAIQKYRETLKGDPNNAEVNLKLARLYFVSGYEDLAEISFKRQEEIDPKSIEVINNRGFNEFKNKRYEKALKIFKQVVLNNTGNYRASFGIVSIYTKQNFYQQAISLAESILTQNPDMAPVQNKLAWLYGRRRVKLDEAISLSLKSLRENPLAADYLSTLASLYYQKGEKTKAVATIQKAIRLWPENRLFKTQLWKFKNT